MGDDLQNLEDKIAQFKADDRVRHPEKETSAEVENRNTGLRAGAELVTSIIAGVVIGVLLDRWLGVAPLFLIIFFLGGTFAGFLNIYKLTQNAGSGVGFSSLHKKEKQAKNAPEKESP